MCSLNDLQTLKNHLQLFDLACFRGNTFISRRSILIELHFTPEQLRFSSVLAGFGGCDVFRIDVAFGLLECYFHVSMSNMIFGHVE